MNNGGARMDSDSDSVVACSEKNEGDASECYGNSGSNNFFPQKQKSLSLKPASASISGNGSGNNDMSKQTSPLKPSVIACSRKNARRSNTENGSPLSSKVQDVDSFDFSDENRAAFFHCMQLKKMFTPSVKSFLTEVLECFSTEEGKSHDSDGEVEYVEVCIPSSNDKQVEISKGSGVCISAAAKQVILLNGSKMGPSKMLTSLVHELFKDRLKMVHGTTTIRPHILKAIITFMDKNSDKSQAMSVTEIKRVINCLAAEARRVRKTPPSLSASKNRKGKAPTSNTEKSVSPRNGTPVKSKDPSPVKPAVITTPSKNTWNVDPQLQPPQQSYYDNSLYQQQHVPALNQHSNYQYPYQSYYYTHYNHHSNNESAEKIDGSASGAHSILELN